MQMPLCKSPDHPGEDRDTMILIEEKREGAGGHGRVTHYVFGCLRCRDVNRTLSVQVRVSPEFRTHVTSDPKLVAYKRARSVERDPTNGKIRYFR